MSNSQVTWIDEGPDVEIGTTPEGKVFRLFYDREARQRYLVEPYNKRSHAVDSPREGHDEAERICTEYEPFVVKKIPRKR